MPELTFNSDIEAANRLAIDYAEQVRKGKLSPLQSHKCAYIDGYIAGLNFARNVHAQVRDLAVSPGASNSAGTPPIVPLADNSGSDTIPTA